VPVGVVPTVEIVRTEEPLPPELRVTLAGLTDPEGPLVTTGETVVERVTAPMKVPRLLRLIVWLEEVPRATVIEVVVALMLKSELVV